MKRNLNTEKNRIEWVLMNMKQRGSRLNREQIKKILDGECVLEAEIAEHIIIGNLVECLVLADKLLDLQEEFSVSTIMKFYKVLSGGEEGEFRKSTPVLYHLRYNPVLPQEIEEELAKMFRRISADKNEDAVDKAVFLHNHLIRIYPFYHWNEVIARLAMEYTLVSYGKTFCPMTLSEQEYNDGIIEFLHNGKNAILESNLRTNFLMLENMEKDEKRRMN